MSDDETEHLDPENLDFGYDRADFEGLKKAIWEARPKDHAEPAEGPASKENAGHEGGGDELDDDEVVKVERMMRKLQAVREAGEGLPEAQRKRMAARAVEEVMKQL